jgi:hypothetical protein
MVKSSGFLALDIRISRFGCAVFEIPAKVLVFGVYTAESREKVREPARLLFPVEYVSETDLKDFFRRTEGSVSLLVSEMKAWVLRPHCWLLWNLEDLHSCSVILGIPADKRDLAAVLKCAGGQNGRSGRK